MRYDEDVKCLLVIIAIILEATLQDPKMGLMLATFIIGSILACMAAYYIGREIGDFFERNGRRFC